MKEKNLLTKFRKFWRGLSVLERGRLWDIMTALRGEDGGDDDLKIITTARIRGLLFGEKLLKKGLSTSHSISGAWAEPKDRKFFQEIKKDLLQEASGHFVGHTEDAIYALKPYVKKGQMEDLLEIIKEF